VGGDLMAAMVCLGGNLAAQVGLVTHKGGFGHRTASMSDLINAERWKMFGGRKQE